MAGSILNPHCAVELCNQHVLFWFQADWRQAPSWTRHWPAEMATALTGAEGRATPSRWPRVALSYRVVARSLEARAVLEATLQTALAAGRACCPHWGWGQVVEALAPSGGDTLLFLPDCQWPWQAGDWAFLADPGWAWTAAQVTQAERAEGRWTLLLQGAAPLAGPAPARCWPLLFGQPTVQALDLTSAEGWTVQLSLTEQTPREVALLQIQAASPAPGVGGMTVGHTLQVASP